LGNMENGLSMGVKSGECKVKYDDCGCGTAGMENQKDKKGGLPHLQ